MLLVGAGRFRFNGLQRMAHHYNYPIQLLTGLTSTSDARLWCCETLIL